MTKRATFGHTAWIRQMSCTFTCVCSRAAAPLADEFCSKARLKILLTSAKAVSSRETDDATTAEICARRPWRLSSAASVAIDVTPCAASCCTSMSSFATVMDALSITWAVESCAPSPDTAPAAAPTPGSWPVEPPPKPDGSCAPPMAAAIPANPSAEPQPGMPPTRAGDAPVCPRSACAACVPAAP